MGWGVHAWSTKNRTKTGSGSSKHLKTGLVRNWPFVRRHDAHQGTARNAQLHCCEGARELHGFLFAGDEVYPNELGRAMHGH